jgi:dephospho-CoA kinase
MKFFGLTGGAGMGKSTVADMLRDRGWRVVDTDQLARQVVASGQPGLREITAEFGASVLNARGELRREALARLVFSDPAARRRLEALLQPRIRELWQAEAGRWRASRVAYAVVVIPLLFETGAETELDATICVACSPATQQTRLRERGWSDEEIAARNRAQWPVEKKMARSTFVLWNEAGLDVLRAQLDLLAPVPVAKANLA